MGMESMNAVARPVMALVAPGPDGHHHYTGFARGTGIAVSRMGGRLLVTDQDVADLVLLKQCIIDVQYRPSGIPEDVLHPLVLQRTDHHFRAG